jgi:hypothetical protein
MLVFASSCRLTLARLGLVIGFGLGFGDGFCLPANPAFAEDQAAPRADIQQQPKTEQKPKKERHRNTPLDTIMQTRLWADVPEPKDFVKDHRPDKEKLEYQPVTGTDPDRPKLRTPAELKDLETELESARVKTDKRAGIKPSPVTPAAAKPKPAAAAE